MSVFALCSQCTSSFAFPDTTEVELSFENVVVVRDAEVEVAVDDSDEITAVRSLPLLLGATKSQTWRLDAKEAPKTEEVLVQADQSLGTKEDAAADVQPPEPACPAATTTPVAAAEIMDPSHPNYVPLALRHGPREESYLKTLGFAGSNMSKSMETSRTVSNGFEARLLAQRKQKQEEEQEAARARLQEFLASRGFSGVNHRRRHGLLASSPLHEAVRQNDAVLVKRLLKAGAETRVEDTFRRTPLQLARKKDVEGTHREVIALLVKAERAAFNITPQ